MTSARSNDWELFAAIRKEELVEALRTGNVQIVNVLPSPGPKVIPSTRHIPLDKLEERLGELDRTWPVVVYCQNRECTMSRHAARLLAERGFHVRPYEGGIEEWTAAGLPTEPPASRKADGKEPAKPDLDARPKAKGKDVEEESEGDKDAEDEVEEEADDDASPPRARRMRPSAS